MTKRRFAQFGLLFFLGVGITALFTLAVFTFVAVRPLDASDTTRRDFVVLKGQGAREIAANLEKAGIISNDAYFNFYVWEHRAANFLQAGTYELSPSMAIPKIVALFEEGKTKTPLGIKITIPEGYQTKQIESALIAAGFNLKESELQEAVQITGQLAFEIFGFDFLRDLPSRATLDGFLFPDTYFFDEHAELNDMVKKMLQNFSEKVGEPLRVKIKARGKNLYEAVIMASLLEEEVREFGDMRVVSGILWKRMEIGMPLQIDATIAYITGKKTGEIANEDKFVDSPYNTYKYRGLPPTPISNPGIRAIRAAADPEASEFLYYLSTPQGETIFAKTLNEHNVNKAKYLK